MSAKTWRLPTTEKEQRQAFLTGQCIGIFEGTAECAVAFASARDGSGRLLTFDQTRDKARLIAAAPELLATLRALTDWAREHTSPRDSNSPHALLIDACAAIAKATGVTA